MGAGAKVCRVSGTVSGCMYSLFSPPDSTNESHLPHNLNFPYSICILTPLFNILIYLMFPVNRYLGVLLRFWGRFKFMFWKHCKVLNPPTPWSTLSGGVYFVRMTDADHPA